MPMMPIPIPTPRSRCWDFELVIMNISKRHILLNSQFSYCSLVYMFHSHSIKNKVKKLLKGVLLDLYNYLYTILWKSITKRRICVNTRQIFANTCNINVWSIKKLIGSFNKWISPTRGHTSMMFIKNDEFYGPKNHLLPMRKNEKKIYFLKTIESVNTRQISRHPPPPLPCQRMVSKEIIINIWKCIVTECAVCRSLPSTFL